MEGGVVAEVALVQLLLGVEGIDMLCEVKLVGCAVRAGITKVVF